MLFFEDIGIFGKCDEKSILFVFFFDYFFVFYCICSMIVVNYSQIFYEEGLHNMQNWASNSKKIKTMQRS